MTHYNQGQVTVNIPDEFSLKDQDHKRIKQSVSEAISENIKDFYINIGGKLAINSSKIVSVGAEYKRYNTPWELEKDGLTEIAELARETHYFETEDDKAEHPILQNIRITIHTVTGMPFIYDSLMMCNISELENKYGIEGVNLNRQYLRLDPEYINRDLNNYITELLDKRENINSNIWQNIVTDVLEELYSDTYGWYMILRFDVEQSKEDIECKRTPQWNHEPHTLYVIDRQETKIIKVTDLIKDKFDCGKNRPSDRYQTDSAEYALRSFLYIDRSRTVYTDNIKDIYPNIPITELSYKENFMELRALREEQK